MLSASYSPSSSSLGPHSMEAHADTRIAVEANAKSAAREFAASHLAGVDARITQETAAKAGAIMKLALEAKVDPSPPTGHSADIYGHSRQCYHHQEKYVAFLQELLCDIKRIPGFPRHSDGKVIVDTHPNFAPPWPKEIIGEKNVDELTVIMHRNYNAAQYLTRMEKHRAPPLNRCCNHSDGSTPGTQCVSFITPMTFFPPRSHFRMSTKMTSALRLIF